MRRPFGKFFADEERALTVLIVGSVSIMAVGLAVVVAAMFFMK